MCSLRCLMPKFNQYASEIWRTVRVETVEKVHVFVIKRFLRLSSRTPSVIVYGGSGRYPLVFRSQIRSIKYWLKLLILNKDRLPFLAYRNFHNLAERGKSSLAGVVKELQLKYGFGEAWYIFSMPKRLLWTELA